MDIDFVVHDADDAVGVVVVEGVQSGPAALALSGLWTSIALV